MNRFIGATIALFSLALLAWFSVDAATSSVRIIRAIIACAVLAGFATFMPLRLLIWIIPLGPILDASLLWSGSEIYLTEMVVLAGVATWAIGLMRGRLTAPDLSLPVLLMVAFGAIGVVALLIGHPEQLETTSGLRSVRVLWIAGVLAWLWNSFDADHGRRIESWTRASLLGLALLALGGIAEFAVGDRSAEPGSFYGSSIGLAVHLAFMMPLALAVVLGNGLRRAKVLAAVGYGLGLGVLVLTASRGALASVALTTLVLTLLSLSRLVGRRRLIVPGIVALGVAGAVTLAMNPELAGESFAYKFERSLEGDFLSTRTPEWREAVAAIQASPLLGEGAEAWSPSMPLEMARRHGIPAALALFGAILTAIWWGGRRRGASDLSGACVAPATSLRGVTFGLIGLVLVGLAETGLGARFTPLLAAAIATAANSKRLSEEPIPSNKSQVS